MKKMAGIVCIVVVLLSLTACGSVFQGSRIGNDSKFIMNYQIFDTTDSQDLKAGAGDTINASIVVTDGRLSIRIQKGDDDPIYESDGILVSNEFNVGIEEEGSYTVTVTGKKAKGSVSFLVKAKE